MCFKNQIFLKIIFLCIGIGLATSDTRECSPNFISNPQFPSSGSECLPEQFLYYSSTSISYYYFIESILNDINLSDEDWVGAFSCEQWEDDECIQLGPCVGARQWGACSDNGGCDIPVFGDDGSSLTSGYMNYNEIPIFKIYNFSNNLYVEAQSSDDISWEYLSNPIISQLSAYDDISGCTDINATNYNMYATINDDSCTLQDSECLFDVNAIDINPSNYEFNGSVTCSIAMEGESIGSENDYLIAYYENEPRGIVNGLYFPVTTSYVYNLMLYSNMTNGEIFSFKYYKASTGETFCLDESINFESDMYIGNAFSPFIIDINLSDTISGCLDPNAINYNPNATIDNDSCLYPEDMVPELFEFNQSTAQAFYFINNILIDGVEISSEDWVGAFNNDLCVGARKWETDLCNNQICEVPIMGDDGEDYSMGYMNAGEIPIFKIYDYSEGVYYDATPSVSEPWYNLSSIILDSLIVTIDVEGCTDEIACNYDSNATADNGTCYYSENNFNCDGDCIVNIDCEGVCGGFAIEDECGVCNGNGILEGECDCSGNVVDCNGECGGVAIEDECGICGGPGSVFDCGCYNIPEEFCDCNESVYDECGICGGPGLNEYGCCENEIQDCNGLCGGSAVLDECGVCDSNSLNDCNQDCLDIWGGDAIYDDCGVCNGNNENIDCEGNCFGTVVLDECGECGGDGSICNAPIAYNQTIETQEDILINFTVDSSDPNNDNLEIQILSNPIHGLLEINDLNITYYPNENYSGTDNIIYKTSDGVWSSNEAQITIIVSELLDAPIISDITVEVYEDQSISIDLGAYDTDSDDDSLEFNIVNGPNYGTLTENRANASYTYIPNLDYNGNDEFIYEKGFLPHKLVFL